MNQVASWLSPTLSAYNVKLFRVSVANGNDSVVKSVLSQRFMEYLTAYYLWWFTVCTPPFSQKGTWVTNVNLSTRSMLSTTLIFTKCNRVTDHYSICYRRSYVFPKVCCHHELNEKTKQMAKLSYISLSCIHGTERNIIFTSRKFVTIYVHSTLHEETEFYKEVKFGSVYHGSCFNATLSCYTL